MKECAKVKRMLSRYLDKETSTTDVALVEEHLDSCYLCKKELSGFFRVKRLMLEKEQKVLPQDFLVSRLREEIAGEQRVIRRGPLWLAGMGELSRRFIPVPAPVIILLFIFLVLNSRQQVNECSLAGHLLSRTHTTTGTALELILGGC